MMQQGKEHAPADIVVQVLSLKKVQSRLQAMVWDGVQTATCMLASQIDSSALSEHCLIQVTNFIMQSLPNNTKVIVALQAFVVGHAPAAPTAASGQYNSAYNPPAPAPTPQPAAAAYNVPAPAPAPPVRSVPVPAAAPPVPSAYYGGGSANAKNLPVYKNDATSASIMPISAINPYSSRWTIKARITSKSDIRRWSNAKGEGTLFSIDLLDSEGGEIRSTFFKDACEKFYPVLEEGQVYTFSGGTLKIVQNRQYTTIKNQYELTFNVNAAIHPVHDDAGIQRQNFNFVKIDSIPNCEVGATIDLVAIVRFASDVSEITSQRQAGKVLQKRELTLVDDTMNDIRLTIWGDKATNTMYDWNSSPVVAFKGLKVGDYGGRSLSASGSTSFMVNSDVPEAQALYTWRSQFDGGAIPAASSLSTGAAGGGSAGNDAIEKRSDFSTIRDKNMGAGEKADYATVKGCISYIKKDQEGGPWYTSCTNANPPCNKKVVESGGGGYHCEKCNIQMQECNYRYILNMTLIDSSGSTWVTLFDDQAKALLKMDARELNELRMTRPDEYDRVFSEVLFKPYMARLRIKQEAVNDEMRQKSVAMSMTPVDFPAECQRLIEAINKY